MPDGGGSGWSGITGVKDLSLIDAEALTDVAATKALKSRKPKRLEPGRYTTILEPRANARFLSLMTGIFNGGGGGFPGGGGAAPDAGGGPPAGAPPVGAAGAQGGAAAARVGAVVVAAAAVAAATTSWPARNRATRSSAICSR